MNAFDDIPRYDIRDPVVAQVRADMAARSALGIRKYGCTLDAVDEDAALQHAYEEALDLALYLKRALMARGVG